MKSQPSDHQGSPLMYQCLFNPLLWMIFGPSQLLLQNTLVHVSFSCSFSRFAEADLLVREHTQLPFALELLNSPLEGLRPVPFPRWGFSRKLIKRSVVHYPGCLNARTQSFFPLEHSISLRRSCLRVCMGRYVLLPGVSVSTCACVRRWVHWLPGHIFYNFLCQYHISLAPSISESRVSLSAWHAGSLRV